MRAVAARTAPLGYCYGLMVFHDCGKVLLLPNDQRRAIACPPSADLALQAPVTIEPKLGALHPSPT
jgi:hypothetical protein